MAEHVDTNSCHPNLPVHDTGVLRGSGGEHGNAVDHEKEPWPLPPDPCMPMEDLSCNQTPKDSHYIGNVWAIGVWSGVLRCCDSRGRSLW